MRTYLAILLILTICLIYALLTALMPLDVFWITDGGNKFITMENIIRDRSDAISYPAADIDAEGKFFPYSNFHFVRHNEKVFSIFPPYFPALASFFYRAAGYWGLYLISIFSTGIVLLLTRRLIQRLKLPDKYLLSLPALGLCTPFFFYSLTFWEMTLTALLTTTAMLMLVRHTEKNTTTQEFLMAGLMMGSAIILREDIYVLAAAMIAAMLVLKYKKINIAATCAGILAIVTPLWLIQYAKYGHILGLHGSKYYAHNLDANETGIIAFIIKQLNGYYTYLLKFNSGDFADKPYYFLLVMPFVLAVIAGIMYKNPARRATATYVMLLLATISSAILTIMLLINTQPVLNTIFTVGLLTSSPLLVPLLLSTRSFFSSRLRRIKLMLLTSAIYCIAIAPMLTQSDLGIIWGARHFIYLFPLLVPLCIYAMIKLFYRIENRQLALKIAVLGIVLCSISLLIQVKGVANLFLMKNNVAKMNNHLASVNEVIVSDIYWLPTENPRLFYNKKFMQVNSGQELEKFIELMKRNNVRTFTLVLAKDINYRRITNDDIKRLLTRITIDKPAPLDLPGTDFLSIITVTCRIKSFPAMLSE